MSEDLFGEIAAVQPAGVGGSLSEPARIGLTAGGADAAQDH